MGLVNEKVIIIIPTYNEALVIVDTVKSVLKTTAQIHGYDVEILVFDSNSSDGGPEAIKRLIPSEPRLHFQSEQAKSGLGSAYLQAMRYAIDSLEADIVFEFDADGSHKPEYIEPMLEKMRLADVVVGSRYVKGGSIPQNWGWHRKLFSVLGNQVARFVLTRKYKDFTSGFRATRTSLLRKVLPSQFLSSQYAYKLHLFWLLHKAKAVIKEHPIVFIDREKGYSKLPSNSITDSLRVVFYLRSVELKNYMKMCLVGLSGALVQFVVFNLMRHLLTPTHAIQVAVTCAIVSNFIFNNKFTFKDHEIKETNLAKRFLIYGCYSFVMVMFQSLWMLFAVRFIGQSFWLENLFVAIGIIAGSVLNYFFYSKIIWREEEQPYNIKMARR